MIKILFAVESTLNDKIIAVPQRWLMRKAHYWLPPLIIISVLLLSAALGYKGSSRLLQMVIVFIPGVVVTLAFLRWPPLGLLALIGTIAIPFNGPSNSNLTMVMAAMLIGLWIVDMMVRRHKIEMVSSLPVKPLLALVLVATLAFGVGQLPWYTFARAAPLGAQIAGLSLFILSAGLFLVVVHQVRQIHWLKWMVWLFLAMGAIVILGRLAPGGPGNLINRMFSVQATGSLFWTWLLTLAFSQAAFNRELHPGWRMALGGLTLATLYVMITTLWAWNSGWVPGLASVFIIIFVALPRLGLLGLLAGGLAAMTKIQKIIDVIMVGDNQYSLSTRLDAWIIVWDIAKINPILGLGPANYYFYTPLFPIRGYAVQFNSHQQYVDLIAQTGILGLVCFIWFFIAAGWLGWQLRDRVPSGFAQAYVYGAIGGVAGTFVSAAFGDWVIPFFYNITLGGFRASMLSWLFLGGLVALEQMYKTRSYET